MKFLKGLLGIVIPIAIGLALALVIKATVVTVEESTAHQWSQI